MIIELTENKEELPFLQNGFDFQKQALRGLFLLNGSATISLLTFFSNVLLKNPQFAKELFKAILFFSIGSFIPVICSLILCLKHTYFVNYVKMSFNEKFLNKFIEETVEKEMQGSKEYNFLPDDKKEQAKEKAYNMIKQSDMYKFIKKQQIKKKESSKSNYIYYICFLFVLVSLDIMVFISGLGLTYKAVENNVVYSEKDKNQVYFTNESYPGVQITPLPVTKPN